MLATAGLVAVGVAERASVGVPLGQLLASGTGQGLVHQAVALAVTAAATGALLARPQSATWLLLVGVTAAGAMLAHVAAGHAATPSSLRGLHLLVQWAHLVAVGVWIGGLVWLLVGIRGRDRPVQVAAAVRFSRIAGVALGVVALTGLGRALDEVGGWGRLLGTSFGKTLAVKTALVSVLVTLGALNRYRIVPALRGGTGRVGTLRASVRGELLVAVLVLVAAVLSELPPGASLPVAATPAAPAVVEASGADYATSVRLTLTITPGIAGPNRFQATVVDYDTGRPVSAQRVELRFALPDRPDIAASTLELRPAGQGRWQGQGSMLSVQGRWQVTALVQAPAGTAGAVTVPLEVLTRTPPELLQPPRLTGPPPPDPPGAVVLGGQAGSVLVGLTAYPVAATLVVRARGGLGIPPPVVPKLRLLAPDGHALGPPVRRCGDGCVEALVASPPPGRYTVLAQVPKGTARFTLPVPLPPPAAARLRMADRTLAASRSYRIHEVLTGGLGTVFRTDYLLKAPDSIQTHLNNGKSTADMIWIGEDRWLRDGSGPWKHQQAPGLTIRFPARNWSDQERNVVDLGPATFHGTRVDVLAFLDPANGAYHRLWVDQKNRILHERMDAPATSWTATTRLRRADHDQPTALS